ncbi:MAG TPA: glycosyltransferase [Ferruginibacter sp.]|nr:glycosyltransferase [Ferruginibacter sp.]
MSTPLITVLMPAYNTEKYIAEAIASVLDQTFIDFELLIINDGSADKTVQVINSFTDPRIRLINQTNQGIAAALNIGLLNARAELIARFDADDICMPDRLMLQYKFLSVHPDHIIVGSDADFIDMYGDFVYTRRLPAHTNEEIQELTGNKCPFIHSAVMFRKTPVMEAGGYNVHAHAFEDLLLWSKVLKQGKAYNLSQKLLRVRLNPWSISIDDKWWTKRFREILTGSIRSGDIAEPEGQELLNILKERNNPKIKEGSYYSLLGKKYLWDNHQPVKARFNLKKAIRIHPARLDSYAIMALSFFPREFINWIYKRKLDKI